MREDKLILILLIGNIILLVSGIIDLFLFLSFNTMIPSWTVTAFTISFILVNTALIRLMENEDKRHNIK